MWIQMSLIYLIGWYAIKNGLDLAWDKGFRMSFWNLILNVFWICWVLLIIFTLFFIYWITSLAWWTEDRILSFNITYMKVMSVQISWQKWELLLAQPWWFETIVLITWIPFCWLILYELLDCVCSWFSVLFMLFSWQKKIDRLINCWIMDFWGLYVNPFSYLYN